MNTKTATLYECFDNNIVVDYHGGAGVYGIYFNYESDASGLFSVLAGADQIESSMVELEQIKIEAGEYLVFKGEGEMPQAVINTWMKIWGYFSEGNPQHTRAYKTDFELYKSEILVEIHIGIEPS